MAKRKATTTDGGRKKKHAATTSSQPQQEEEVLNSLTPITVRLILSKSLGNKLDSNDNDNNKSILDSIKDKTKVDEITLDEKKDNTIERILTIIGNPNTITSVIEELILIDKPPSPNSNLPTSPTNIKFLIPHLLLILINRTTYKLPTNSSNFYLSKTFLPFSNDKTISITSNNTKELQNDTFKLLKTIQNVYDFLTPTIINDVLSISLPYQPQVFTGSYGHPDTFKRQSINELLENRNPYINQKYNASTAIETSLLPDSNNISLPTGPASMRSSPNDIREPDREATTFPREREHEPRIKREPERQRQRNYDQDSRSSISEKVVFGPSTTHTDGTIAQQLHIPNDIIGSIIGKSGLRITEIRQQSGCTVKIGDAPSSRNGIRLVTIVGKPSSNKIALDMIHKFIESDRWR